MGNTVGSVASRDRFLLSFPSATAADYERHLKKFKSFLRDGATEITHADWTTIFGQMPSVIPDYFERIFEMFDTDHNDTMSLDEFLLVCGVTYHGSYEQKIRLTFKLYDKDNSGALDKEELREMMVSVVKVGMNLREVEKGNAAGIEIPEELLSEIIRESDEILELLDDDKSGTLDIDEVLEGCALNKNILKIFSSI